jgi:DNA-binding response OmpR family regulator
VIESRRRPVSRVVIVEPHDDSRELCAEYFAWAGVDVIAVPTVADALRMADLEPPDAVITCLRLPDGDGFALSDALRATPHGDRIRVIALSTSLQDHERAVGDTRFESVVMKPCLPEILVGLVHGALAAESIRQTRAAQLPPDDVSHGLDADGTSPTGPFGPPRLTVRSVPRRNR